ncbi:MFS transporter [Rhizobium beringeri]
MDSHVSAPGARSGFITRSRAAVSLLFLMNGFVVGCWAPKIPDFAERLALTKFELGLPILVFGVGSLVMMPIAGAQIAKHGSRIVVQVLAVCVLPLLLALTLAPNVLTGAISLFLFGGFIGAMDVAMNANAVSVEKSMRRAIMSSCHAFWSLGGLIGSGLGGIVISKLGVLGHAQLATVLAAIFVAVARPMVRGSAASRHQEGKTKLPMVPLPWLLGLMALFSMVPEGAVLDWGALYLRQEMDASVALSGLGFAAFRRPWQLCALPATWCATVWAASRRCASARCLPLSACCLLAWRPMPSLPYWALLLRYRHFQHGADRLLGGGQHTRPQSLASPSRWSRPWAIPACWLRHR